MLLGTLVQTIVLLFITLRTDWEKQVCPVLCLTNCNIHLEYVDSYKGHNMLNYSEPLSAGGDCSRETEEMVHGREQKNAGLEEKSLNWPCFAGC